MSRIPKKLVTAILDRDSEQCQYCGCPATDLHHIAFGGMGRKKTHKKENLISLCRPCHSKAHQDNEMRRWCEEWSRKRYGNDIDLILKKKWSNEP